MKITKSLIACVLTSSLLLSSCQEKSPQNGSSTTNATPVAQAHEGHDHEGHGNTEPGQVTATPDAVAAEQEAKGPEISHTLVPLPGKESVAPKITQKTTIEFRTTAGPIVIEVYPEACLLYTSPSPRDQRGSRMPSSA